MSDTKSCDITELQDKPNLSQEENVCQPKGYGDLEGSCDPFDSEASATSSESETTDSYEEDGDWEQQISFAQVEKHVLYGTNPEDQDLRAVNSVNLEVENSTNLSDEGKEDSNTINNVRSAYDIFEKYNPPPVSDSNSNTVAPVFTKDLSGKKSYDESLNQPTVANLEERRPNLPKLCEGLDCNIDYEDKASKIFSKKVPLHASETWDFSLQALDKDFKSKVLWVEGSFYQKFIGKCFHEMHNVPCECEEKKKISVCRLCHAVFCSNKCFKRAMRLQTGEDAPEDVADDPELRPEEVKAEPKAEVKSTLYKEKGEATTSVKESFCEKIHSTGYAPKGKSGKWASEKNRQIGSKAITERRDVDFNQHQPQSRSQQQYTGRGHFEAELNSSPVPPVNMWPKQVFGDPSNKRAQMIVSERNTLPQNGIVNKFANNCMESQDHSDFEKYECQNSKSLRCDDSRTDSAVDFQNEYADKQIHAAAAIKTSQVKDPLVKILRNPPPPPNPILSDTEEQPKSFFRRGRKQSNSSSSNSPKRRSGGSDGEQTDKLSEQNHRTRRYNFKADNSELDETHKTRSPNSHSHNENFNSGFKSNYEHGKPSNNSDRERRSVQSGSSDKFAHNNLAMKGTNAHTRNRGDYHQPYKNHNLHNNTKVGTEHFGRSQEMPILHNFKENFGQNRTQATFPLPTSTYNNYQSSNNEIGWKKHGINRSDDGESKYSTRSDQFKTQNNNLGKHINHGSSFSNPNQNTQGPPQHEFSSSSSRYSRNTSSQSSTASSSSSSSTLKPTFHSLQAHDNIGVPYGVVMHVKYVRGQDFSDFSVITIRNSVVFKRLHQSLQTCGKVKMDICEVNNQCLVKYRAGDLEDSQEEWYRGVITKDILPNFGVYLFDLGVQIVVRRDAVYNPKAPVPSDYNLGPLAIRIRALNVKVNNDVPDDVFEQFNTLVRERPVKIKITHKDTLEPYKFGCNLHVQHIGKWFDAGILLKKLLVGDQVPHKDIHREEAQQLIVPCKKFILFDELLTVSDNQSKETEIRVTHVISPNEFYIVTAASNKKITGLENEFKDEKSFLQMKPVKNLKELSYSMFLWEEKGRSRARVRVLEVSDNVHGVEVLIQKVDTGEILTVPMEGLKKLPTYLQNPTSCAYKCSLPIKPVSKMRSKNVDLFSKATVNLEDLKRHQASVYIKVFSVDQSNTHIVDLYLQTSQYSCTSTFLKNDWVELTHDVDLSLPKIRQCQKGE